MSVRRIFLWEISQTILYLYTYIGCIFLSYTYVYIRQLQQKYERSVPIQNNLPHNNISDLGGHAKLLYGYSQTEEL